MKKVIINKISLTNFKGVRSLDVSFSNAVTSIYGKNASGKTTIFDAFTWLLFGKNSEEKKQFNVKTLDRDGKVIPKIPHEVTAILDVDGETITLTRRLAEKWQKKRGSAVEEFKGNEEERLFNDVPLSVKEWNEKITSICAEDTFKAVTNPLYFTSLKWDAQRAMLIRMAGDVTDAEVIGDNQDFNELISSLNGKSLDEYKREIVAKKKRIKEDVDTLPSRIDERRRDASAEPCNWLLIEARLHHKEQVLAELQQDLQSGATNSDKLVEIGKEMMEAEKAMNDYYTEYCRGWREKASRASTKKNEIEGRKIRIQRHKEMVKIYNKNIAETNERRQELIAEWRSIKARVLTHDDDYICPVCGRPLKPSQIEEAQAKALHEFNTKKIEDLKKNETEGKKVKQTIETWTQKRNDEEERIKELEKEIATMEEELATMPQAITDDEINDLIASDTTYNDLTATFMKKQDEYNNAKAEQKETSEPSQEDKDKLDTLKAEIAELQAQMGKKDYIEQNEKRIKELEEQLRTASAELARLEGTEYTINQFTRTRIEMLEERINAMFSSVRFKLFDTQINGGEVETCQATWNGVPYADLNNAMKINAGLDIINAICKSENVSAPIFIDNAEAVNELLPTDSQMIRLVVSDDNNLRIENN